MSPNMMLMAFLALNFVVALSGGVFRPGAWYEGLAKPWWRPPNWLFGPAWAVLYIMIAVAGWLVWRKVGWQALPFAIYGISLVFNAAWSACAFGLRRMDIAFADLVLLWLSVAAMIAVFWPLERNAALLLLPYIVWVSFAGALNFTIWRLNRT